MNLRADKGPLAAIVARSRPSELRATSSDQKPESRAWFSSRSRWNTLRPVAMSQTRI